MKQAIEILLIGYRAGSDLTGTLRAIAVMVMETLALVKERRAVFTMQKYTLTASLAIIVPVILGSTFNLASALAKISTQTPNLPNPEIIANSVQIYLALASAITAYFIASAEGQRTKAVIYFLIMFLPAIVIFTYASSGHLFA